MPRDLLGQDRVFRILREPTDELVSHRVPDQPLVATIVNPGELKEFTPHPTEPLPRTAILRAEDERPARHVVFEREPPDLEHVLEAGCRRVDVLDLAGRLPTLRDSRRQSDLVGIQSGAVSL